MAINNIPDWFLGAVNTGRKPDSTFTSPEVPNWVTKATTKPQPARDRTIVPTDGMWPSVGVGAGYSADKIKPYSYYNTPIVERQFRGRSRKWGDADPKVIDAGRRLILDEAAARGLSKEHTAMVMAMTHHESGFNPDAASNESAHGLGQFINSTGRRYKLTDANRWDIAEHYVDNMKRVEEKGLGIEYQYVLHHDGSFNSNYGGLGIAQKHVMPLYEAYLKALK